MLQDRRRTKTAYVSHEEVVAEEPAQEDLAALVGMKQPAIARLETSEGTMPQWRTLDRIAFALGKRLTLNLGDADTDKPLVGVRSAAKRSASEREHHPGR